ncbi:hypothetical protein EG329_000872 [Mollisiaceae sp. DMI_Dod_QoI]|nr:hypothetical protein EG329_000872 [Helotiales sp. DMI_Dod_QoI]
MADSRTFTCFAKFPLEIRNMIWEEAANLPRNLDIWTQMTGTATYGNRYADPPEMEEYKTFRFTTRQPVPGFLLATKESRAATRKYFELSFGNYIELDGFSLAIKPEILRNFETDRICPMGPYTEDSAIDMWCANPPLSCAVNVYQNTMQADPLNKLFYFADGFHKEILLYYCEEGVNISGSFDFVDISQDQATTREWKALENANEILKRTFENGVMERQKLIKHKHDKDGKAPRTEAELDLGWEFPKIRFVALVANSVRH